MSKESPVIMIVRILIILIMILYSIFIFTHSFALPEKNLKTVKLPAGKSTAQLNGSQSDRYIPPPLPFPSVGAVLQTSKMALSVKGTGILGESVMDPLTGRYSAGFNFPNYSGNNYLFNGALWFGGIVNGDTLVSIGYNLERYFNYDNESFFFEVLKEMFPPDYNQNSLSTTQNFVQTGQSFRSVYVDTFTDWTVIGFPLLEPHRPLNIEVIQNSYIRDEQPYKNIVLLDYTIINRSDKIIKDACVGLYIDPDIRRGCTNATAHLDDLAGSFRELGFGYCIDNDGELMGGDCSVDRPLAAIALKPVFSYPPATDTTFHWWLHNYDFGPRMQGTQEYPYREFTDSIIGIPTMDANKYFMMRKPEWDYDQIRTSTFPFVDTTWRVPPGYDIANDIANGSDTRIFMSLGPYTIQPDSAVRVIYALFMGDLVHIVDTNLVNLMLGLYDDYYDNLFFDVLKQNAEYASELTTQYLQTNDCPNGFEYEYFGLDSICLSWDRNLLEGVTGYNIYIKKIPDSLLICKTLPRSEITFESIESDIISFSTSKHKYTTAEIDAKSIYAAVVTQEFDNVESSFSEMIFLNHDNPLNCPTIPKLTSEFTPMRKSIRKVEIDWMIPTDTSIAYFKIYKAPDSIAAFNRYTPFSRPATASIPFVPYDCQDYGNENICYYQMQAYDSIPFPISKYIDSLTNLDAYYWVTAVDSNGFESDFSSLLKPIDVPIVYKDILVLYGSTTDESDFIYEDDIANFYIDILSGYTYDLYNWSENQLYNDTCESELCVDWKKFAEYKMIIIEEFPSPKILTTEHEKAYKIFTRLSDVGQTVIYFGTPPGSQNVSLNSYTDVITYAENGFEQKYMGVFSSQFIPWLGYYTDFPSSDTLGGFRSAIPAVNAVPLLHINPDKSMYKSFFKQLFNINTEIPFISVFEPAPNSDILYRFSSSYPNSSLLENRPVGVYHENSFNHVFTFGFHLPSIDKTDARKLIDYMYNRHSNNLSPQLLPNSILLTQNYPNPFNNATRIEFAMNQPIEISLFIYNILGQKVTTLIDNQLLTSGNHVYFWDAKNDDGSDVSTGVYFYRLETEDEYHTKKMVFLK